MTPEALFATTQSAHQLFLLVQKLAIQQQQQVAELLRSYGLSGPQFNVLRILRGAGGKGLTCSGIGDQLMVHDPDVTRLLDRLEKAGLVQRERDTKDRRVVLSFITPQGLKLLHTIGEPLAQLHRQQFEPLDPSHRPKLVELLTPLIR